MVGGRASRSTTPSKQFIIHAMQVANRAYNWQTCSVLGKSKLSRQRMKHPSPAAIGVPQSKKTHGCHGEHGFVFFTDFFDFSIDLCVLSIPLIMWWFNGFWASSFFLETLTQIIRFSLSFVFVLSRLQRSCWRHSGLWRNADGSKMTKQRRRRVEKKDKFSYNM